MKTKKIKEQTYWVYIVKCNDGSYYTGIARDLDARVATHNSGKGAKYTNARKPVVLIYSQQQPSRSEALKQEYAIKQLSRQEKEKLIDNIL